MSRGSPCEGPGPACGRGRSRRSPLHTAVHDSKGTGRFFRGTRPGALRAAFAPWPRSCPHPRSSPLPSSTSASRPATARVGIVGLGYAGLPLAMAFAEAGFESSASTSTASASRAIGAKALLPRRRARRALRRRRRQARGDAPTTPPSRARRADDLRPDAAVEDAHAGPVLRRRRPPSRSPSTSAGPAGDPAVDHLPRHDRAGHRARSSSAPAPSSGEDIFLGYAPERVDPGNTNWTSTPRPSSSPASRRVPAAHQAALRDDRRHRRPVRPDGRRDGEAAREHVPRGEHRARQRACADVRPPRDLVWEVIDAASSKPFGFLAHYPGPGLGGDCIPVVPHFLAWRLREYGYGAR